MAIFKKLSVGDIVATSGTRAFKKLTMEEPGLPIWNGTDLRGTTWVLNDSIDLVSLYNIPTDDTEEDIYGLGVSHFYNVDYVVTLPDPSSPTWEAEVPYQKLKVFNSTSTILEYSYSLSYIGVGDKDMRAYTDTSGWGVSGIEKIRITGGTDATNPRLINWLLENGRLTSHQFNIKGFWYLNDTITQLPIVYADGEDLEQKSAVYISSFTNARTGNSAIINKEGEALAFAGWIALPAYDFTTNSWTEYGHRYVLFTDAIATNYVGEDITPIFYKWLRTNTTKPGQITFTIDGETYKADEGMNWHQWDLSDYDTGGYEVVLVNFTYSVGKDGYNGKKVHTDSGQVDPLDAIIAGYDYILA